MADEPKYPNPILPRITKSTAVSIIERLFPSKAALLKRYVVAKTMAGLWDGERDGLNKAVKEITDGTYDDVVITRTTTAAVNYPNAEGKAQLENCLQCTVDAPSVEPGTPIVVFTIPAIGSDHCQEFLDRLLHVLQKGKDEALEYLRTNSLGIGQVVDNAFLYKKEDGERASITILPSIPKDPDDV